jgi:hypothetical protein
MALGFILIGVMAGLGSAIAVWSAGGGLGLAFLAYAGCGTLVLLLGAALALVGQGGGALGPASRRRPLEQPHS